MFYKSFKTLIHGGLGGGFSSCHPVAGSPAAQSNLVTVCALWVFLKDKQFYHPFPQPPPALLASLQLGISLFASQRGPIFRAGPASLFLVWES